VRSRRSFAIALPVPFTALLAVELPSRFAATKVILPDLVFLS